MEPNPMNKLYTIILIPHLVVVLSIVHCGPNPRHFWDGKVKNSEQAIVAENNGTLA